ncbi:MAG TPA: SMC family ATPase [Geothermobacteraceae bacterium]|nr:SMC family ATPase [Geothermobacteraceae bacterium]
MQILSIQLKNIKSHRELELDFSSGINVLAGPNGAGKSTIFEAIGYALFGVDAQNFVGNVERFISIGAKKGEIAVIFQVDDERFRVSRSVGTPAKWLLAKETGGEFEVEEHKDIRETEARLKELLGLEGGRSLAEQFELVIGPFQHEFLGPFVIKQPTRRRDKFDEILGIDSWRKTFSATNTLQKAIKNRIEVLEGTIGPLKEQVAALPEKREAHAAARKGLDETEAHYLKQLEGLRELEKQLIEIDKREQAVKDLTVKIDELKVRIDNGKEKIAGQKALIDEAEKARQVVSDNADGKQAFEAAGQRLAELRELQKTQRRLEQDVAALDKQLGTLTERHTAEVRAIEQSEKELDTEEKNLADKRKSLAIDESVQKLAARLPEIRATVKDMQARIGQLDGRRVGLEEGREKLAEGICPFFQEACLNIAERPPGDVFSAKFANLEQERNRLQAELKKCEQDEAEAIKASEVLRTFEVQLKGLDELTTTLAKKRQNNAERAAGLEGMQVEQAAVQQELNVKQESLKAFSQLQADIEKAETEQKKHQAARDLYVANQEQAAKLEGLQIDLKKFAQLLTQLQGQLSDKEKDLTAAGKEYDPEQHRALRLQKDTLQQQVGALGQKVEGLKADVARLAIEVDKLKQIEKEIAAKKEQIKDYGKKEELVKFLRNRVFRNVSASLSERFREEISQRANRIYRIIAEVDEELAWGEDYRIVLRDLVDGELRERFDDQLSGGQIMSAVVALRLAMLQTIGARIAFFDEPTSNLDATRRENLARAFRAIDIGKEEVTEHWYDQLFLISHDVAFNEVTDQLIEIVPLTTST